MGGLPGGSSIRVAMHTPLLNWAARNATLVSDELAIFQLEDQVVAMNPRARKMGLLTLGRGPIVILEESDATAAR